MTERLEKIEAALDEGARREFVEELIEENQNSWDGGDTTDEIVKCKYAIVIRRSDDAWVVSANTLKEVAEQELEVLAAEYDVEWVDSVYDLATGETISYQRALACTIETDDGQVASAQVPS